MIPGIDFAGTVESSDNAQFQPGDNVILNGWGIGETHFGGYAQKARVKGDWLVKRPDNISAARAMAIGTAGYTAMLCVMAIEPDTPTDAGEVLVTGAAGGVGSVAIALLSKLGYQVVASTGRPDEAEYLTKLGAARIIERDELSEKGPPLGSGKMGRRCRRCGQSHAGKCHRPNTLWWYGSGLRFGARAGSAGLGHAVYFARRYLARH